MAGLGRNHKNLVHRLLRARQNEVKVNQAWLDIFYHFEVGRLNGNKLYFSAADHQLLRELAQHTWGFDPLDGVPDGSRIEVARSSTDDKLATQRPGDHYILAKTAAGPMPWAGLGQLPQGSSLRLHLDQLDRTGLSSVVVIENLDCFDSWHRFQLPGEMANILTLYRGHDALAKGVRNLLMSLSSECRVIVFPDLDPAGLQIAHTTPNVSDLLLPKLTPDLVHLGSPDDYFKQNGAIAYLEKANLKSWQCIWQELRTRRTSIKQQHMLAHGAHFYLQAIET